MNNELYDFLNNIQLLFDTGELTRKLEGIRAKYYCNTESEKRFTNRFGHVFSRTSFKKFKQAVNKFYKRSR
ncbi:hypothetical protein NST89_06560 [Caldifermentibacillus hisashii]|mgnify:CR=1 FL=1|uniref:hypothetical protein n=1 Tax=Caldifermentibacillus hisashii TaxID=996558 RepID=UPI0031361B89